jgi:hypothetical protein
MITRVAGQSASNHTSTIASGGIAPVTLPNNPTTGNLVVVSIFTQFASGITIADANGNSYVATTNSPQSDGNFSMNHGIWYLQNAPANASKTINATVTAAGTINDVFMWAAEYAGAQTASVLEGDAFHINIGTSQTNVNDPSMTTTNDGDLLWAAAQLANSLTSANSPWTAVATTLFNNGAEDLIQTTHGAQAVSWTQGTAGVWTAHMAAFIAAPAIAAAPFPLLGQIWM